MAGITLYVISALFLLFLDVLVNTARKGSIALQLCYPELVVANGILVCGNSLGDMYVYGLLFRARGKLNYL